MVSLGVRLVDCILYEALGTIFLLKAVHYCCSAAYWQLIGGVFGMFVLRESEEWGAGTSNWHNY